MELAVAVLQLQDGVNVLGYSTGLRYSMQKEKAVRSPSLVTRTVLALLALFCWFAGLRFLKLPSAQLVFRFSLSFSNRDDVPLGSFLPPFLLSSPFSRPRRRTFPHFPRPRRPRLAIV